MSHHLYHTDAFVLKTRDSGEANKIVTLYTRELGLVNAKAQGIRYLKSKLRYGVQDGSQILATLVRGKEYWRLINAAPVAFPTGLDAIAIRARMCALIDRLIKGEEQNEELYDHLLDGFKFIEGKDLSEDQVRNVEIVFVLNILFRLGYLGDNQKLQPFISFSEWTDDILDSVSPIRQQAIDVINHSFEHIHL